jgi:hypothetical protein
MPFISISAPSIVSGMSGESEKTLRETFEEAQVGPLRSHCRSRPPKATANALHRPPCSRSLLVSRKSRLACSSSMRSTPSRPSARRPSARWSAGSSPSC